MPNSAHFSGVDVRRGMDVYATDGAFLGCVVRVETRYRGTHVPAALGGIVDSIVVGQPWRPWGRRRVPAGGVRNVSMERVVLADGA